MLRTVKQISFFSLGRFGYTFAGLVGLVCFSACSDDSDSGSNGGAGSTSRAGASNGGSPGSSGSGGQIGGNGGTGNGTAGSGGSGTAGTGGTGGPGGGCTPSQRTFLNHGSEGFFACAAEADGIAQCWGEGYQSTTPKKLVYKGGTMDVTGVVQFAAVGYNGCVLLDTGAVHCWTSGDQGQPRPEPVIAADVVQISGGYQYACALIRPSSGAGSVKCWQVEQWGAPADVTLEAGDDPVVLGAGYKNECIVLASGAVKCWGANGNGQLGNGGGPDATTPQATGDLGGKAIDIAVGNEHVCALLEGGAVKCWGQYNDGKLGFDAAQNQTTPGPVAIESGAVSIAAGKWHTCAIMGDGSVKCWGKAPIGAGATPTAVAGLSNVVAINGGRDYACAVESGGALKCWGSGQAGTTPTAVTGVNGPIVTGAVGCD